MSDLENRNAEGMMQTLKALREELSLMNNRLGIMERRLKTLGDRNDQLDSLVRHLQAAAVGRGASVKE